MKQSQCGGRWIVDQRGITLFETSIVVLILVLVALSAWSVMKHLKVSHDKSTTLLQKNNWSQ